MRFLSLAYLGGEARKAFSRFPLVLVSALIAVAGGVAAVERNQHDEFLLRFLFAGSLGLPLFTALGVHAEKNRLSRGNRLLLQGAGILFLVWFFLVWPHWLEPVAARRYIQLSLGFHLLAAVLPYLGRPRTEGGDLNGFWQYNRILFLRFLTSVLYTVVLYAGIAIAVLALDKLFGLHVPEETYLDLWILCAFLGNTWIFVGGIPDDHAGLEGNREYPRGLRVFSQFILVPLVTLYLVILSIYMGKIAITRVWPSGWIGYLVSSVSVVGILSLLLVFPVAGKEENRWMRTYSRWFYVALLPSVAMLLLAVFKRTAQYGITENRYFMIVLAVWLALIAIYFVFSRGKNIKIIPATLAFLAFATSFGPWGAYAVSDRSQTARLERFLTEKNVLVDGRIQEPHPDLSFEDRRELSAMLHYLLETHGPDSMAKWFEDGLAWADTLGRGEPGGDRRRGEEKARRVMAAMGETYVERWQNQDMRSFNLWSGGGNTGFRISDYDYVFHIERVPSAPVSLEGAEYRLIYEAGETSLVLEENGTRLVTVSIKKLVERGYELGAVHEPLPVDRFTAQAENDGAKVLVFVRALSGNEVDGESRIGSISCDVYLRKKAP